MSKFCVSRCSVPALRAELKQLDNSVSTEESPRDHPAALHSKEKSQLCKKFMEKGYCPYEKRCKFAHGLNELKKNDQLNCRYKTRTCGRFRDEGFCTFGDRCNFIHPNAPHPTPARIADPQLAAIKAYSIGESRLLKLLKNK